LANVSGGFVFTGLDQVKKKLESLPPKFEKAVEAALYAEALEVKKLSMQRTPVDTGALRASHVVNKPERDGKSIVVNIEVGGPAGGVDVGYAIYVHENLEAFHKVGQAKFLESAHMERSKGLRDRVAKRVFESIA
jgi:hypothetical protein